MMASEYKINCPYCGVFVFESSIKQGIPQKYEDRHCKYGHEFTVNIGRERCDIITIQGASDE